MARSLTDIKTGLTASYVSEMAAIGIEVDPSTWSAVSLERLIIFVVASAIWVLESLFDVLRSEVDATIASQKPGSERWYASMALAYQHGHQLLPEAITYDNTGYTQEQIDAEKVVKYAAVVSQTNQFGRVSLRIKLAGSNSTDLTQLPAEQVAGVREYFKRVGYAGVTTEVSSGPADNLRMQWDIYYDPLILDGQGSRLDGSDSDPVGTAIRTYLTQLPFNGALVLAYITDAVQEVPGVNIPVITGAQAKYGDLPYQSINVQYLPDAGYVRFYDPADLQLNFIPQSTIK